MMGEYGNEIFNFDDVCKYLKISKHTLYKYTQRKEIPAFRIGKELRFRKESIDKWLKTQERKHMIKKKG